VVGGGKNAYDMYENGPSISNVIGLGGNVIGLAGNVIQTCFTEGTQIVVGMEYDTDGNFVSYVTMNIEDVNVGDLVYSYNTLTGATELCEVTDTFVRESDHINYLTILDEQGREQTIETTDGHPFWVVTDEPDLSRAAKNYSDGMYHGNLEVAEHGFWVEAKDLRVGDVFLDANGELSILTNIVRVEQAGGIAVFNFTVEGNHDYFVLAKEYEYGQSCVLVHNANARFYVDPNGNVVDTHATPRGSYTHPDGSRTDILQRENHGFGFTHTHHPIINTAPDGRQFINGMDKGRLVTTEEILSIQNGISKPSLPKGRW
jgi:hypothetical protein